MSRPARIMVSLPDAREAMGALAHVTNLIPENHYTDGMTPEQCNALLEQLAMANRMLQRAGMPMVKQGVSA